MVTPSRLIAGIFFILVGIALLVASFYESFILLIYASPSIFLGIWLWVNKNEDKIEERQDLNKSKSKK